MKTEFPILKQKVNNKRLVYLDNAATSQKPISVIQAMNDYYEKENANVHRGLHELSMVSSIKYENAHQTIADFLNASFEEIIFTKGTTESINFLANSLLLKKGDEIIVSEMEHHSNFVPWQQLAKEKKLKLKIIPIKDYQLDMKSAKQLITKRTKVISITHMSNVLGTINPIKELTKLAHKVKAIIIIDAAQSAPHMKIDVKELNCDFLAFSGHKTFGPTGIGVLYGKKVLLEKLKPFQYGGGMIKEVSIKDSTWNDLPWKFEAGTPNIAEAIGLAEAINYIKKEGIDYIKAHNDYLTQYALDELSKIKELKIIGPKTNRGPVISFTLEDIHPHDLSEVLNQDGIAIRSGNHCAMPLMNALKINGTNRISFQIYNSKDDVNALINGIKKAQVIFK